jgi:hypothetical protein
VFNYGANNCHVFPFITKGIERRFLNKSKDLLHQNRETEFDEQCIEISPFYGEDDNSSDEEMANNKFVGCTSLGASEFHSCLLADTASRRKLKAR